MIFGRSGQNDPAPIALDPSTHPVAPIADPRAGPGSGRWPRKRAVLWAGGLAALAVVLGFGVHRLHRYQVGRQTIRLLREAERAAAEGKPEVVVDRLERYLQLVPGDASALASYGLALSSETLGRSPEARERALSTLERALLRDPTREDVRRRVVEVATALGRFEVARGHIERLRAKAPEDAGLMSLLGRCEDARGRFAEAATWFDRARQQAPGRLDDHARLAHVLRTRLADPSRADAVMDEMVKANPAEARAYLLRGDYRASLGRARDASADLAHALSLAPESADALAQAAGAADTEGDAATERRHLATLVRLHPNDPRGYVGLAKLDLRSGDAAAAVVRLRDGLKAVPKASARLLRLPLADALVRAGRFEDAAGEVARLRAAGSASTALDVTEARTLIGKGDWAAAVTFLERVLESQAGRVQGGGEIYALLGLCHGRLGNPDRQLDAFRRALDADPGSRPARLGRAEALVAQGRLLEALAAYRELAPDVPEARLPLARLLVLQALQTPEARRAWPEVDRALDEAGRAAPEAVEVPLLRSEALVARGRFDEARATLDAARTAHPREAGPWVARAELALRQGRPDEAQATLDAAGTRLGDRADLRLARAALAARQGENGLNTLGRLAEGLDALPAGDQVRVLEGVAALYRRAGRPAEAGALLRSILEPGRKASPAAAARARRGLALLLAAEGGPEKSAEAVTLIETNLAAGGSDGDRRAHARLLAGHPTRLRDAVHDLEALEARHALTADDRFLLARLDEAVGDWPKARGQLLQLVSARDRDPGHLAQLAAGLLRRNDPDQARDWVAKLSAVEPDSFRTAALRARLLKADGRAGEAETLLNAFAEGRPDALDPAARLLDELDRPGAAEALYRKAVARAPRPETLLAFATFLGNQGRTSEALDLCDRARQGAPPEALGAAYLRVVAAAPADAREEPRVERWFKSALRARPGATELNVMVAVLRGYQGRYRDAEAIYRHLLEAEPRNVVVLNNLAWLLALKGNRPEEALILVERAVEVAGVLPDLLDTRAVVELALKRWETAAKDLEASIARGPTAARYFHLARARRLGRDPAAAAAALRAARALGLTENSLDPMERDGYREVIEGGRSG